MATGTGQRLRHTEHEEEQGGTDVGAAQRKRNNNDINLMTGGINSITAVPVKEANHPTKTAGKSTL